MEQKRKYVKVNNLIARKRIELGLTQADLAKKAKIKNVGRLGHLERNTVVPEDQEIVNLAKVLKENEEDVRRFFKVKKSPDNVPGNKRSVKRVPRSSNQDKDYKVSAIKNVVTFLETSKKKKVTLKFFLAALEEFPK